MDAAIDGGVIRLLLVTDADDGEIPGVLLEGEIARQSG